MYSTNKLTTTIVMVVSCIICSCSNTVATERITFYSAIDQVTQDLQPEPYVILSLVPKSRLKNASSSKLTSRLKNIQPKSKTNLVYILLVGGIVTLGIITAVIRENTAITQLNKRLRRINEDNIEHVETIAKILQFLRDRYSNTSQPLEKDEFIFGIICHAFDYRKGLDTFSNALMYAIEFIKTQDSAYFDGGEYLPTKEEVLRYCAQISDILFPIYYDRHFFIAIAVEVILAGYDPFKNPLTTEDPLIIKTCKLIPPYVLTEEILESYLENCLIRMMGVVWFVQNACNHM